MIKTVLFLIFILFYGLYGQDQTECPMPTLGGQIKNAFNDLLKDPNNIQNETLFFAPDGVLHLRVFLRQVEEHLAEQ